MLDIIRTKLADAIEAPLPELTRRDIRLAEVPNKVHAVIGMRRTGKTCFLHQCLQDRLANGQPRQSLVYFSFDDERLAGMEAGQLHMVLEEYYLRLPQMRDTQCVTFCFDEIQNVSGWESFVRRVQDSENADLFVSGSSARLLSREVATALRGRAMETLVYPFSFREFLRHRGVEPEGDPEFLSKATRSALDSLFGEYLVGGGFPEAQGIPRIDLMALLQGYVDVVILRDVIERHRITNTISLRHLTRQLLGSAGGLFSVHRLYNDQKSQGITTSKDTLHEMLGHLEDAFLIRLVPIHAQSERKRQTNRRKAYPVDPGLIPVFDRSGKANIGRALETAVLIELERRQCERAYILTPEGFEVDFFATPLAGSPTLIQVCADVTHPETRTREFRALTSAMQLHPGIPALLLTQSSVGLSDARQKAPEGVTVLPAWEWMLG